MPSDSAHLSDYPSLSTSAATAASFLAAVWLLSTVSSPVMAVTGDTRTVEPAASMDWSELAGRIMDATREPHVCIEIPEGGDVSVGLSGHPPTDRPQRPRPTFDSELRSSHNPLVLLGSFEALPDDASSVPPPRPIPPDTQGAVGPDHAVTMLNTQFRVQDRSGTAIDTILLDEFWQTRKLVFVR